MPVRLRAYVRPLLRGGADEGLAEQPCVAPPFGGGWPKPRNSDPVGSGWPEPRRSSDHFGSGRPEPFCSPGPLIVLRNEWGESGVFESRDSEVGRKERSRRAATARLMVRSATRAWRVTREGDPPPPHFPTCKHVRACAARNRTRPASSDRARQLGAGPPHPSRPIARAPWDRTWMEGGSARRHHI